MGLFGKKSTAGATSASASQQSASTASAGNYVAPAVGTTTSPALIAAQSKTTPKVSIKSKADPEQGATDTTTTGGPPSFTPEDLTTVLHDDPTNDDRTYRTEYTSPTLLGMSSDDDDDQTKDSAFTITRNGEYLTMNGFANGHLMRWKFAAEEGPAFIRFPAVLLALAVISTTLYPVVSGTIMWNTSSIICASHTCIAASLILILEGRVFVGHRSPTNLRARLRTVATRYFNAFRLLWGRGVLYIYVASMNMTIDHLFAIYTGIALAFFGLIAIVSGAHASYNLDKLKTSLTDEAFLWSNFDDLDSDNDNCIDLNEFAELLWSLGLEFDDAYTYKAFSQIERDAGAKISFEQFREWWIVTQHRGRPLRNSNV
jgi:hypothetical protein